MPNSSAICISGRPLDCNNAMASRLNSSVKLRRGFVIKHPSCPFPERNKGVHQFGGGSVLDRACLYVRGAALGPYVAQSSSERGGRHVVSRQHASELADVTRARGHRTSQGG